MSGLGSFMGLGAPVGVHARALGVAEVDVNDLVTLNISIGTSGSK
jgi:hypothetical protein